VALGTLAFAVALLASVHRQRGVDVKLRRIDVLAHQVRWSASHGEPEEALASLRELAALDPRRPRLAYDLGLILLKLHQVPEAVASLAQAVAQAPGDGAAWRALSHAQRQAGDLPGAEFSLGRATLLDPSSDHTDAGP